MADDGFSGNRLPTILESALQNDRSAVVVLLIFLPLVSWLWIVIMARDMYGRMSGASAWMMTAHWDLPHLLLLWAMWAVMMTAMMLPSVSPMLLLFGVIVRRSTPGSAALHIYALAAGYLLVWSAFSVGATALQRLLAMLLVVSSMMEVTNPAFGAALLVIAGLYQFDAVEVRVSESVHVAAWVFDEPVAQWTAWCFHHRTEAWRLLRRLLLGAHVGSVCRRRDEPDRYCSINGIRCIRKTHAIECSQNAN
jgi:hypothetical protein